MLNDITNDTKWVLDQFIPKNHKISNKKSLYDLYRALHVLIDNVKLVSEHYLALDFTEDYLQNSSFGDPADKWRYFFNKDLESLNEAAQKYWMKLDSIASAKERRFDGYLSRKYNSKTFYAFIRDNYNVGYVKPCGFEMISSILNFKSMSEENHYIKKFSKIDLSTYEQRIALQKSLREKNIALQEELLRLKGYIQKNISLEDLLIS
ncbi:MAG: hypothetical protein AB7E13_09385 [Arcobacteraceae bacterium]